MIRRSYGDRIQCWPSGINCQNFVLDKGTISILTHSGDLFFFLIKCKKDLKIVQNLIESKYTET